jgi:hypothetical protein
VGSVDGLHVVRHPVHVGIRDRPDWYDGGCGVVLQTEDAELLADALDAAVR